MDDIDSVLERIRINSVSQSIIHKKTYIELKERLKWFKIPIILLSALNSVFSIGLQPFMQQGIISVVNSLIALLCGIIGSVELYLQLNKQMEQTLISSKDFYVLATDIFKFLALKRENRPVAQKVFIDDAYNRYIKLVESSLLLKKKVDDQMTNYKLIEVNGIVQSSSMLELGLESPSSSDDSV
jgi:hypothetical protein